MAGEPKGSAMGDELGGHHSRTAVVARSMRVELDPHRPPGSMSGSAVHAVRRADGEAAILKVTVAADGPARRAAERELMVYAELGSDLPVRIPALLDHRHWEDVVALLLRRHPTARPAGQWQHQHWMALAEDLGRLHDTIVPDELCTEDRSWLITALQQAPGRRAEDFWSADAELLRRLVANSGALAAAITGPDRCLGHGDCHTDNILVEPDGLAWTDWQSLGPVDPGCELAFAAARAVPSGARVPLPEMINRYARVRSIDDEAVHRTWMPAVLAAELAILTYGWPDYAEYNTADGNERVRRRVRTLAGRWFGSAP